MTDDPHPWSNELGTLYGHAWHRLIRGVHDRHAPARHPTLATVSSEGLPHARTVVLRQVDRARGRQSRYSVTCEMLVERPQHMCE